MTEANPSNRIPDDIALLDLMMADMEAAPELFRPTNYWFNYQGKFLRELRTEGLDGLRGRKNSGGKRFGGTEVCRPLAWIPIESVPGLGNRYLRRLLGYGGLAGKLERFMNGRLRIDLEYDLSRESLRRLWWSHTVLSRQQLGARPITDIETSLAGNPEDVLEVDGKRYTPSFLSCYLRYAYCSGFVDFDELDLVVELGSGVGSQIEVLKKFHPRLTVVVFDIAPQLYVCEQYLKTVFPDDVVSYGVTREWDNLEALESGKIHIMGTSSFPALQSVPVDLFLSSASLQEMEPDVVANYLKIVNETSQNVFLRQNFGGMSVAKRGGAPGVLRKTEFPVYENALADFELIDRRFPENFNAAYTTVENTFWRRR